MSLVSMLEEDCGRKNTIHMRHWRSDTTKAIVVAAVEVHEPKGFGRIRMRRVPQASWKVFVAVRIRSYRPIGSLVHTDGLPIYQSLPERGYRQRTQCHYWHRKAQRYASMPAVDRVASLLKRWLLGTHQGAVQARQLARSSITTNDTFRFNRIGRHARAACFSTDFSSRLSRKSPSAYCDIVTNQTRLTTRCSMCWS